MKYTSKAWAGADAINKIFPQDDYHFHRSFPSHDFSQIFNGGAERPSYVFSWDWSSCTKGLFLVSKFLTYTRHVCAIFIDNRSSSIYLSVDKFPLSRSYARLFLFSSNPMTIGATFYFQHPVFPVIVLEFQVYVFRGGNQGIRKDWCQVSKTPLFFYNCSRFWRLYLLPYSMTVSLGQLAAFSPGTLEYMYAHTNSWSPYLSYWSLFSAKPSISTQFPASLFSPLHSMHI